MKWEGEGDGVRLVFIALKDQLHKIKRWASEEASREVVKENSNIDKSGEVLVPTCGL
jgi:hypothetical protein